MERYKSLSNIIEAKFQSSFSFKITTINDLIKELEKIENKHGNLKIGIKSKRDIIEGIEGHVVGRTNGSDILIIKEG